MRRGEERRHRPAFGDAEQHCPLGADGIEHRTHVVHAGFQVGQALGRDSVREPGAAFVKEDEPPHRCQSPVEVGQLRVLPARLERADPAVDENEVDWTIADDLVGDPDVAAARVRDLAWLRRADDPG